jgi:hypothetical protein
MTRKGAPHGPAGPPKAMKPMWGKLQLAAGFSPPASVFNGAVTRIPADLFAAPLPRGAGVPACPIPTP